MPVQMNIERQPVIQCGNLVIDPQCCMVLLAGEAINLYPKEFDALLLLAQYPGWVLSWEQIYEAVWKDCTYQIKMRLYEGDIRHKGFCQYVNCVSDFLLV